MDDGKDARGLRGPRNRRAADLVGLSVGTSVGKLRGEPGDRPAAGPFFFFFHHCTLLHRADMSISVVKWLEND